MQLGRALKQAYPHVEYRGEDHPPAPLQLFLSRAVTAAQWMVFAAAVFGESLEAPLGLRAGALKPLVEQKMPVALGSFFVGSTLSSSLVKSSAFEVTLNGQLVWSGLEQGRPPQNIGEVLSALESAGLH